MGTEGSLDLEGGVARGVVHATGGGVVTVAMVIVTMETVAVGITVISVGNVRAL